MAIEYTIECIDSIKNNINYDNQNIVVVDNGSPNNSGYILKDKYKNDTSVNIIISDKNLGFAKGNNLGYKYAKEFLNSNYIVVLNNDTVIEQEDFSDKIIELYNQKKYHVLGPDIISTRIKGHHQNPCIIKIFNNKDDVKRYIKKLKIGYYKCLFKKYTKTYNLIKRLNNNANINTDNYINYDIENVKLHGSCLIFSKKYISENEFAFNPNTFMYMEEDILYYECKKKNYKTLYSPSLKIYHKEDISTEALIKRSVDKDIFIFKNSIDSCKVIYDIVE
jgi:GT2 family glycosyltransferase